jgi:hypothetical protein
MHFKPTSEFEREGINCGQWSVSGYDCYHVISFFT